MERALSIKPHDLLALHLGRLPVADIAAPAWVAASLKEIPFAVCRRGVSHTGQVLIGVRGPERNQRWPAVCPPDAIEQSISPQDLLKSKIDDDRMANIPALESLELLKARWQSCTWPWGPGGSVGFELATHRMAATHESDLDIILRIENPISKQEAAHLCRQTEELPAKVDIRVETQYCGFSLREYASQSRTLLRYPGRQVLSNDPWEATS